MRRNGFTLVELTVTVLIVSIIGIYVGYALAANERAYQSVDQTAESQQNLRAVLDLMERDARHAAMMMPEAASACGVDATNGPDTLYLADGSAIDPDDDTSEYGGVTVTAGGAPASGATVTLTLSAMVVEEGAPFRAAVDTNADGTTDSDFRPNGGVILFDANNADLGVACGHITNVNAAAGTIIVQGRAGFAAAVSLNGLRALPANEYRIVGTNLEWNGVVLAGNIEDMQIAWIFDSDQDNIVDNGEIYGAQGVTQYDSSGATLGTNYESAADLRELRIGLVARTRLPDDEFKRGLSQAMENRDGTGFVNDGYRRRVMLSRIRLRNLGLRS